MLQITRRNALTTGNYLEAQLRVLKMCSDVVEGSDVARSHNSARAALTQRRALADCERHEIVDVGHDSITQLRGSQSAILQCRFQISQEKPERFGSATNRPHGEAVDILHARRQRVARHGQAKL